MTKNSWEPKTAIEPEPEWKGRIIVEIPKDPAKPMTARIEGEIVHKHILSVQGPILKAFRAYMSELRSKLMKEIPNDNP